MVDKDTEYLIAIGLDGSPSAWKALEEAIFVAKNKQAPLHVVSIQEAAEASFSANEVLAAAKNERHHLDEIQLKARTKAEAEGIKVVTSIVNGPFSATIIDYLKKKKRSACWCLEMWVIPVFGALY